MLEVVVINNEIPESEKTNESPDKKQNKNHETRFRQSIGMSIGKLINRFCVFLKSFLLDEDNSARRDLHEAFNHINTRKVLWGFVGLAGTLYMLSGVYTVQPGEIAVVRTLGKISNAAVVEGLHYRLPWPMGKEDVVNITEVRRETIGLEREEPDHPDHPDGPGKIQVLSGDTNIVDYVVVVQYKVKDPVTYLFNTNIAQYQLVRDSIRASVTKLSASIPVDDILVAKRQAMLEALKSDMQGLLETYKSGIQVVSVNFQKAYPPDDVADAFQDVQSAKEDKEKAINQALGYQNSVLPEARGQASRIKAEADAYAQAVVDSARGSASSFEGLLAQYRKDNRIYGEDVTRFRLYLETMERIMKRVKTYVVEKGGKADLRMLDAGSAIQASPPAGGLR
ncbi:MAG: FtsH protease activity modulator HflK [Spirochaetae bacterium HGW-Spirochaetae-9]|nr:MAG: FtsH protease activity modulator HflK [Spirochaetae bacterium HGW-Spirochaetae-9]